jgi:hypothetical protein
MSKRDLELKVLGLLSVNLFGFKIKKNKNFLIRESGTYRDTIQLIFYQRDPSTDVNAAGGNPKPVNYVDYGEKKTIEMEEGPPMGTPGGMYWKGESHEHWKKRYEEFKQKQNKGNN